MIALLFVAPSLSCLQMVAFLSEVCKVSVMHVQRGSYEGGYLIRRPRKVRRVSGPKVRFVVSPTIRDLGSVYEALGADENRYIVIATDSVEHQLNYGLTLYPHKTFSQDAVMDMVGKAVNGDFSTSTVPAVLAPERDVSEDVHSVISVAKSFIQLSYPLLYRIPKADREPVQLGFVKFLCGRGPWSDCRVSALNELMKSKDAAELRKACSFGYRTSVEEALKKFPAVPESDVRYIVSRAKKLEMNSNRTQARPNRRTSLNTAHNKEPIPAGKRLTKRRTAG